MPDLGAPFNPEEIEPAKPFELLPDGWYAMQIIASERRQTKKGDGELLALTLELMEAYHPSLKGRQTWDNLNLWNPKSDTCRWAAQTLSAICKATSTGTINASEELHFKPFAAKVAIRPPKDGYDERNIIKGYDALNARFHADKAVPADPGHASVAPGAKSDEKPPWST